MSENRIRKTDTTQVHGPASAGIWVATNKSLKMNPDGTARDVGPIVFQTPLLAAASSSVYIGVAPFPMQIISAKATFSVASTSGTAKVVKGAAGTAVASGTDMTATMSLAGTADTPVSATLHATAANLLIAAGEQIGVILAGTLTSLANCTVTITFRQL